MFKTEYFVQFRFCASLLANAALFITQTSVDGVFLITFASFNIIRLLVLSHGLLIYLFFIVYLLSPVTSYGSVTASNSLFSMYKNSLNKL